jgi:hypothetical protein
MTVYNEMKAYCFLHMIHKLYFIMYEEKKFSRRDGQCIKVSHVHLAFIILEQ